MASEKGNYIPWSVTQIIAGGLCGALTLLWNTRFLWILLATLAVIGFYKALFRWDHKADEREMHLMLRVFSLSGISTLAVLTVAHRWLDAIWINALWSTALISRGVFGLLCFKGTAGVQKGQERKDNV